MVERPECMTLQYYIVNALGFALQLVPAMFIVSRPFDGKCYRMPRWTLWIVLASYGAAVSLAFPLVVYHVRIVDTALLGNFYLLAVALVFAAAFSYVVDAPPVRKLLVLMFGVVYAAVQYSVVNLLLPLVAPPGEYAVSDPYSLWGAALFAITTAIMLPFAVLFQEKALRRYLEVIDVRQTRRDMLAMVAASAMYLLLMVSYTSFFQMQNAGVAWMAAPVGLLFTVLFALFLYYHYHLALVREQELTNRIHTEVFVESARLLQKEIDRARDVRHDLRHLLRELGALSDEQATPEIRRCIGRIEELTRHADTVFCDNKSLNALLQYYAGLADEGGIPIDVTVACGALDVDEADLVLAVGNVLENALTATGEYYEEVARTGEDSERTRAVKVIGEVAQHVFMMQVTNPCARVELADDYREVPPGDFLPAEAFLSTHDDGGRGLLRVSQLAERYGGSAEFRFDASTATFTARVALAEPQPGSSKEASPKSFGRGWL